MTSTNTKAEVLKQDSRGRVRVRVERREALLDGFEKSGASGATFARLAGIKYATFAGWVLKRRRKRLAAKPATFARAQESEPVIGGAPRRLFEALVEGAGSKGRDSAGASGLWIELPGGSRLVVESPMQLQRAAELVALIAQRAGARC